MSSIKTAAVALAAATFLLPVKADEWHVSASYSTDQLRGARIGYRTESTQFSFLDWAGSPQVSLEMGLNHWQDSNDTSDNITALTISPVFQWQLTESVTPLYLEAGIGGSYFDKTRIGDRRLSTQFQFEDRVGLSWQYSADSKARITVQYSHYSNADIERPNDGLDFYSIYWVLPI
jgi:hypothetical protein